MVFSYRVDAYKMSDRASDLFSFFGDKEVQIITSEFTNVTDGTFTVAYDKFSVTLPGTVSAFYKLVYFNTTLDLSSYLEPGDQVEVGGKVYTVASFKFIQSWQMYVDEQISIDGSDEDLVNYPILARSKTDPIQWDVTQLKLSAILSNTNSH